MGAPVPKSLARIIKLHHNDPTHYEEARKDNYLPGHVELIPRTMHPPPGWAWFTPELLKRFERWAAHLKSTTT